jgi:hypothetical protein
MLHRVELITSVTRRSAVDQDPRDATAVTVEIDVDHVVIADELAIDLHALARAIV